MARSKQKGIAALNPSKLPAGISTRQKEFKEAQKDDKGDVVKDEKGNTVWNRSLQDVPYVESAEGVVNLQKYIGEHGPDGYDGNTFLCDLVNSHLSGFPMGTEIAVAPSPNYVDPAAAVQRKIADAFAAGTPPDAKTLNAWYKEAGLL